MLAFSSFAFAYSDAPQVMHLKEGIRGAVDAHFGMNPGITMVAGSYENTTYEGLLVLGANDNFRAYVNMLKPDYELDGDASFNNLTVRYKKFEYGTLNTTKADFDCRPNPALSNPEYQVYLETETLRDFSDLLQRATAACLELQQWVAAQPTPVPTVNPQLFPQISPSPTPAVVLTRCETDADCVIGGCSSQLCILRGENGVTTCEWADYYACFQRDSVQSTCGCVSGKCSWDGNTLDCVAEMQAATPTPEPTIAPTLPSATVTPTPTPQPVPLTDSIMIIVGAIIVFGAAYYAYQQLSGKKKR